ncbi:MAG: long-chain fatty acid--CoA ligase [Gammaproteobacteria bacterium]|nr:long-chain fatty acid--CoA ligase [Gammaproteobacteria bacterium]MBU1506491.1 long-chain fatty acid--CoA ligase [Gammaproteobacteria bacterium]MBU2119074.1 long-chain fatty acid--CoA ligase [Gammaproteobacteria bacterium]MBU2171848.1 long-chain fatty acid--CoA ligase [Gammaproteobacteria bacterium]MBU2201264.1 long-chain fatty acid--CoA ligase [Gammaproteobacteria bacterium]
MTPSPSDIASVQTLPQLLAFRAARTPHSEAYRAFDPHANTWVSLTWADTAQRVSTWAQALAAMQLPTAARVAILLPNGLNAMCADQSTLATGCVPVPLHAIDNPGSIAYILADCEASMLIVSQAEQWEKIQAVGTPFPALRAVVITDDDTSTFQATAASGEGPAVGSLAQWLTGTAHAGNASVPKAPEADDLAAIVYTSGTTGKPKGVMLTHRNVVSDVKAVLDRIAPTVDDVFLSFLPLSHTFERTGGYYLPIAAGSCVAYARSVQQLADDLRAVRPTVLVSVPRIYERIHAKLLEKLSPAPWKMQLYEAAQHKGWARFCAAQGLPAPAPDDGRAAGWMAALPWPVLQALVAQPLLAQFGGRVRVAVSGGAPLSPTIAKCFLGLGLPLIQGYGMTETAPVVSVNSLDDNDPACVGKALPGVDVRIGDNRELQVRGPIVMKGYWKRPEDTAKILSADGWLGTGDQAEIVNDRIYIKGRIKEIIVTSTGEKVPPGDLELALLADPLLEQAFVVGENRPFIACVAVLKRDEWQRLAADLGLAPQDADSLNHPSVHRAVLARIEKNTASFARYAVPRAVHLTLEPWTIENTFMTPTLKLKRNNLMAFFAPAIEGMYQKPGGR